MKSGTFYEKYMKTTEKHLKGNKKATDSTHISYYDLVFCKVQREGQLDISYILVVLGGVCGACMFKWYMYTHIVDLVLLVFMKSGAFYMKTGHFLWKPHEKHWKHEKHMKSEKHTWKVRSTWKVKSTWIAYLKSESI